MQMSKMVEVLTWSDVDTGSTTRHVELRIGRTSVYLTWEHPLRRRLVVQRLKQWELSMYPALCGPDVTL